MNLSLAIEPLLSLPLIALILLPLALLAGAGVWLGRRGSLVRLGAVAALGAALLNPVLLDEEREALKSIVALVVDRSQSQDIGNRTQTTDAAVQALKQRLERSGRFDLRVTEAGRSDAAEERTETRLFAALQSVFRDVPPSRMGGAILVTDGQVHDVPASAAAIGMTAPVHALITGEEDELDRRIQFIRAPRFGIVGKPLELIYRVTASNDAETNVNVRLTVNGEEISVERAPVGQDMPLEVTVPTAGPNIVEIEIEEEQDEITATNNRAVAMIDGIRENLRVLLVSGEPHAGERTWRNLLKSDASVDLVHFTILRPPEKQDGTPINELSLIAFPTRELFVEKIDDFDLIIFDRYQHRDVLPVLYYDYIAQYVENGGALLIAAGPEYAGNQSIARTPLIPALPGLPTGEVVEQAFYPRLTETGERHPVTRGLDGSSSNPPRWSRWFRLVGVESPAGDVVMKGANDQPLMLLNRFGKGRVGMLLSDHGWLWARGFEGGGPHVALYRRLAHWLMREPELEEERLTARGSGMTLQVTRQSMAEEQPPVEVVSPSGERRELPMSLTRPGIFSAEMTADQIGLFQVIHGDLSTLAHVGPVNAPEFAATVSTTRILEPLAKNSGGTVRRIGGSSSPSLPDIVPIRRNTQSAGRDWIGLKTTGDSILKSVDRTPLFGGFFGLAILILALGSTWYREGR